MGLCIRRQASLAIIEKTGRRIDTERQTQYFAIDCLGAKLHSVSLQLLYHTLLSLNYTLRLLKYTTSTAANYKVSLNTLQLVSNCIGVSICTT